MKAIVLNCETKSLELEERAEPSIQHEKEIKLKVLEVGICGTDREEAKGSDVEPPPGTNKIILGHEMLGQVVEVGRSVTAVKPGDLAAFTVRRGCAKCSPCLNQRSDLCETGDYKERGIKGLDGYQTEFVVDQEEFLIPIPAEMRSFAVLSEPMSVIEKAMDEIERIQKARLVDWEPKGFYGRRVLVAGLGPIGLLASLALRLRGAEVLGLDIVDPQSSRPQILKAVGGTYLDGRKTKVEDLPGKYGEMEIILEAAGIASLDFSLWDLLGQNGIYALTGVTHANEFIQVDGGKLMQRLVFKNQVLVGSVNAAIPHWKQGVKDLRATHEKWGEAVLELITDRLPYKDFKEVLCKHGENEIKAALVWES